MQIYSSSLCYIPEINLMHQMISCRCWPSIHKVKSLTSATCHRHQPTLKNRHPGVLPATKMTICYLYFTSGTIPPPPFLFPTLITARHAHPAMRRASGHIERSQRSSLNLRETWSDVGFGVFLFWGGGVKLTLGAILMCVNMTSTLFMGLFSGDLQ